MFSRRCGNRLSNSVFALNLPNGEPTYSQSEEKEDHLHNPKQVRSQHHQLELLLHLSSPEYQHRLALKGVHVLVPKHREGVDN